MTADHQLMISERLAARVKVLMVDLLEFYEPSQAMLWFISPQPLLDRDVPFLLLQTTAGFRRVRGVLASLKDGAYI